LLKRALPRDRLWGDRVVVPLKSQAGSGKKKLRACAVAKIKTSNAKHKKLKISCVLPLCCAELKETFMLHPE